MGFDELYRDDNQCCGTCKYHVKDDVDWLCGNELGVFFTYYTAYTDVCDEWEER